MRSRSGPVEAVAEEVGRIDASALVQTAQIVAGNFDPVDPALAGRLSRFVDWLNEQPPLRADQKHAAERQLRKILATRLRLGADRKRIIGIAQEKIERPIFVIGFARTGTTLIHSLMAEDPNARAPLWWHTHEPSPPPGEVPVMAERIEYAARELDELIRIAPGLLTLHPYWDKRGYCPIECEEIFTLDFQNAYPSLLYNLPALAMILDASNIADAYRFHREFLQHLQWNQEPRHWVVKGIYHQFALKELFEAYPDALCIWPHRDPVEVHPSTLAITAVLYGGITNWQMDFKALGPAFVQSIAASVAEAMESPVVDDPRIFHVDFHALTRDPVDVVRRAYGHWGLDYTPEFARRMQSWLADPSNASNRYGRYDYAMEPFGLTRDMIETAFKGYSRRFRLGAFA
ncbi:putative sulfotransferase [Novosphingobium endophyticum]|uniref:Sulfotransferase n=1 Tax=Novosphingobium endophyticum TaxID=1955250 RepID=A0A916X656_9SPHN|nr:sulfotransferase [Novosphingobium endophyticum]GGC03348.1 putative sulfotransferase [Novosphingobium endophyticum]